MGESSLQRQYPGPGPDMPSHRPVWHGGHPACTEDTAASGQGTLAAAVGDPNAPMGGPKAGAGHRPGPGAAEPAGHPAGPGCTPAAPAAPSPHLPAALGGLPVSLPGKWAPCALLCPWNPITNSFQALHPPPCPVSALPASVDMPLLSAGGPGVSLFPVVSDYWVWGHRRQGGVG